MQSKDNAMLELLSRALAEQTLSIGLQEQKLLLEIWRYALPAIADHGVATELTRRLIVAGNAAITSKGQNEGIEHPNTPTSSTLYPARFVVLDDFLVSSELNALLAYTIQHESSFQETKVMRDSRNGGVVDNYHRRSRALFNLGPHEQVIVDRVLSVLPYILRRLDHPFFEISRVEAQLTATNDGEFFKMHNDNTHSVLRGRTLTYVFYFYREPKGFDGGELRLYDSRLDGGRYVSTGNYVTITPYQNQVVFFPSFLMHEVMPVRCASGKLADSRFTVNGWLHSATPVV